MTKNVVTGSYDELCAKLMADFERSNAKLDSNINALFKSSKPAAPPPAAHSEGWTRLATTRKIPPYRR